MTSLDYSRVADIYDGYCVYDGDIPFWVSLAKQTKGRILELMAGTGRVSLPLMEKGRAVVCVDRDAAMLSVLRQKAQSKDLSAQVICADASDIPFSGIFDLVLLPFQGFSELVHDKERWGALRAVVSCLTARGIFVCTLHNPHVRLRTIDGMWHEVVKSTHPKSRGSLEVSIKADFDPASRIVSGIQRIDEYDEAGKAVDSRSLPLSFSLLEKESFGELAEEAGLEVISLFGDYSAAPYDQEKSPVMVWFLRKNVG